MHLMKRGGVEDKSQGSKVSNKFRVNPKLEEENEQAAAEIIDDSVNIQAVVSKMNNYELREALVDERDPDEALVEELLVLGANPQGRGTDLDESDMDTDVSEDDDDDSSGS